MSIEPPEMAIASLRQFMTEMLAWEKKYYRLLVDAFDDAETYRHITEQMLQEKYNLLEKWFICSAYSEDSLSPTVQDPAVFDPDRDMLLTVEVNSNREVLIEHVQRVGAKSKHRFKMVLEDGIWLISKAQYWDDRSGKWISLIL